MRVLGKKYKVYLETEDGMIGEFPAISASFSIMADACGPMRTEINLIGYDEPMWIMRDSFLKKVNAASTAQEWKCDFCGRPNQRADETCKSCGAVRSFIYGS